MNTFLRFLYEFLSQFFRGVQFIIEGLFKGFVTMFNFGEYLRVINDYKNDFTMPEWILVGIAVLITLAVLSLIIFVVYFLVRKYIRIRKTLVEQESLLEEVATLNNEVAKLIKEKETILAMKVSKLGLKPDEPDEEEPATTEEGELVNQDTDIRFPKLYEVDERFKNYKVANYNNSF